MQGLRSIMVGLAVFGAILVPLWFLAGAMGTRFGLLDWTIGFGLMTFLAGPFVLMGALGAALLALGLALIVKPRKGIVTALVAALIPAAGLGYGLYRADQTKAIPPIHDISTDTAAPPEFSRAVADTRARLNRGNDVDFTNNFVPDDPRFGAFRGKAALDLQKQAYPGVGPIMVEIDADDAFMAARDAAEALGWQVGAMDQAAGRLEASTTSLWFGFTDDIVVRVRPAVTGVGATVDIRSASRVGISDMGANAARILAFKAEIERRVAGAATGN
jgi:uncharacterized protein (DUF1499 family)